MKMPTLGINYSSPDKELSLLAKVSPLLAFYKDMMKVVYCANRDAKKGNYPTERWVQDSYDIIKAVEVAGGKVEVEGMEMYTEVEGPCVFVANHMSTLETFSLPIFIQPFKDVSYIVKSSLATYPFFGAVMRTRAPILLERTNPREDFAKALKEGVEMLASGRSLIIFPQGTRKAVFNEQDFNSLGAKIAKKAKVPLVAIALKTDFWGIGKPIKDLGLVYPKRTVHFKFSKPMLIEGAGKEEHSICLDFISSHLKKWQEE